MERGVNGNTPDFGPGDSRFEPLRSSQANMQLLWGRSFNSRMPHCECGDTRAALVHPPSEALLYLSEAEQ